MNTADKHALYARIATIAAAVILLALFIFPRLYLTRMTDELGAYTDGCMDAVLGEDWPAAASQMERLQTAFSGYDKPLRLFLDHEDVDELEGLIARSARLAGIQERAHLVYELESITNTLEYLKGIEVFTIFNLF